MFRVSLSGGLLFTVALLLAATPVAAGSITARWDAVNDPGVAGYWLYYGDSPGVYGEPIDVGRVTERVVTGLADCRTWYLAVKSYNAEGDVSVDFSNEISGWPRPEVSGSTPSSAEPGQTLQITVTGNNFRAGAAIEFDNPDIVTNSTTVNSCGEIVAEITVSGSATAGTTDLDAVNNPSRAFGRGAGIFTVLGVDVPPTIVEQPRNQTVTEGRSATFSVTANGTAPLSYQWQRAGADVAGANSSSYTTPPTTLADDGSSYRCVVTNSVGSVNSDSASLTVGQSGPRVEDGLLALWDFEEGAGSLVRDVSGVGAALDLQIANASSVAWLPGALDVTAATIVESAGAAGKIIDAVKSSGELTVETWTTPDNATQGGPARLLTISGGTLSRNFTLGQSADEWELRLRATGKTNQGTPELLTPAGTATTVLTHIVVTRTGAGIERIYIDGVERASQTQGSDLTNWDDGYVMALANEVSLDRAWLGELHLVAVYDRALGTAEVGQNFDAGPDGTGGGGPTNLPPTASFTADPTQGDAPLSVLFDASASSDPDGTITDYDWDFGDGSGGSGATVSHEYSAGSYTATLTVTDDQGARDQSSAAISVTEPAVAPAVTQHPQDRTVDVGQSATFAVTATGTAPLEYQWQRNGADVSGANGASYTTAAATLADDGDSFRCVVSNGAGSDTSDPATLTVVDTGGPELSNIRVQNVTGTTADVRWETDEAADSDVSYRKTGDDVYQQTGASPLVTGHAVELEGLVPDTTYEYHVASTDPSGNSSTSSDRTFTTGPSLFEYLTFETEAGELVTPVSQRTDGEGFGAAVIEVDPTAPDGSPGNPSGTATFGFNVADSGPWYLWVRMRGSDARSNTWFESIDSGSRAEFSTSVFDTWQWVRGRSYSLQPGLHSLELGGAEGGAMADRVLLTDDPDFTPTEQPGGDVIPPNAVVNFAAVGGNAMIDLVWANPLDGDYRHTVVRYRTDGAFPTSPVDGFEVIDKAASPGTNDSHTHTALLNGTTYHYSAFALDVQGNVSEASHTSGTPAGRQPPGQVKNARRKDKRKGKP